MTDYDVAVVGGGSAGVAAAIAAARCGARTLLIERAGCLSGASTLRNVVTYCGLYTLGDPPRQAVAGIAEEVMQGLRRLRPAAPSRRVRGVRARGGEARARHARRRGGRRRAAARLRERRDARPG